MNDTGSSQITNYSGQEIKPRIDKNEQELPAISTMAVNYGVSEAVLSQAMAIFEKEGYIPRRQGTENSMNPSIKIATPFKERTGILIVEDDPQLSVKLREILSDEGYTATIARDGKEAINCFKNRNFELIFLDLRLPEIGGVGVLNAVRQYDPGIKVVVVAGHPEDILNVDKGTAFPDMVIPKPFRLSQIREALSVINKK